MSNKHNTFRHQNKNDRRPARSDASVRDVQNSAQKLFSQTIRYKASIVASTFACDRRETTDQQAQTERFI